MPTISVCIYLCMYALILEPYCPPPPPPPPIQELPSCGEGDLELKEGLSDGKRKKKRSGQLYTVIDGQSPKRADATSPSGNRTQRKAVDICI